jgi:hypothetical protein
MTTGDSAVPAVAPAIVSPMARRRTRLAGALLVTACLLVAVGALLPWVSAVSVNHGSGATVRLFTWQAWGASFGAGCGLVFPLFAIALVPLSRAGLRAVRGRPPGLGRWWAVGLALLASVGTVAFEFLLGLAAAYSTFSPYWGRGTSTVVSVEAGFPVSLAGYLLAGLASLLLPPRVRSRAGD